MKKTLSILLALLLVFSLSVPAFAEEAGEVEVVEEAQEPQLPKPTILKSPLDEPVKEGGSAWFTAAAENYTDYSWRIVSPDGSDTIQITDVEAYFGCTYDEYQVGGVENVDTGWKGKGTQLILYNIPADLDGWYVAVKFDNGSPNNYSLTDDAMIVVLTEAGIEAPSFSVQPEGLELRLGETGTLSAAASTPGSAKTRLQWYANSANSTEGGILIPDATEKNYTPEQIEGTTYYYVVAYSEKGNSNDASKYQRTEDVVSDIVAVTYVMAPVEEEPPVEPEEETPTEPTVMSPDDPEVELPETGVVVVEEEPAEASDGEAQDEKNGDADEETEEKAGKPEDDRTANSMKWLIYAGGALAAAALIGGITALIVRRRAEDEDYEDDEEEEEE